ncbi:MULTISPECIES: hypothetical protein [Acetobacter]|uniref:Uncharacterized protein n=1 Tax=Acetobacter tropicalis TaxID=104102 RepID=A0A291PHX7_9PROT|nr:MULTISPECIES: hypothetical protein [Acetobacter]ATJ90998.1 hypothetical protein CIW82_10165 [Acetobacter tropicalis]
MNISSFIKELVKDEFNRGNVPASGYSSDGVFEIIDDCFYDTDTAEKLATVQAPELCGDDFDYYREELYRTEGGAFFLVGRGHGCTPWTYGGYPGHLVIPMTDASVRRWLQGRNLSYLYIRLFGMPPEAGRKEPFSVLLPEELTEEIFRRASAMKIPVQTWIEIFLRNTLEHESSQKDTLS